METNELRDRTVKFLTLFAEDHFLEVEMAFDYIRVIELENASLKRRLLEQIAPSALPRGVQTPENRQLGVEQQRLKHFTETLKAEGRRGFMPSLKKWLQGQ